MLRNSEDGTRMIFEDDQDYFLAGADDEWLDREPPTGRERERLIEEDKRARRPNGSENS